jgi:hypothetical protein
MATGQGTVTIDFGVFPGSQEAAIAFADATISGTSKIEAYVMAGDSTTDHTANDHKYLGLWVTFTAEPIAGVGGTIYARALDKMTGTFKLRYIWSD